MYKLYIFVRTDLESMVPGKAAAQATHAATDLSERAFSEDNNELADTYRQWVEQAGTFGTVLVMDGGNLQDISDYCCLHGGDFIAWNIINDPTYPVRDGDVTHLIPLDTCVYIFTDQHIPGELY